MVIYKCDLCGRSTKRSGYDVINGEHLENVNRLIRGDIQVLACDECYHNYWEFVNETDERRESTIRKWIKDQLIGVKEEEE